jgi:hypothetical protein
MMGVLGDAEVTGTLGLMGVLGLKNTRVSGGNELVVGAALADAPDAGATRRKSPEAGVALAGAALADAALADAALADAALADAAGAAYIGARSIGPPPPGAPTREKYCG